MNAWRKTFDENKTSGIRFLGDASGEFVRALDLEFDAAAIMGNNRSKRSALLTKDGKIVKVAVEPDNIGHTGRFNSAVVTLVTHIPTVSSAEQFLS